MLDLRHTFELLSWVREVSSGSVESAGWLGSSWTAMGLMAIGLILAMWGARVLRVGFVFVFMAIGATAGKSFADSIQVDLLIGLVVGAGVAGAIGYALYRWCLGMTVATVAALIVAATFSAPALLKERQAFDDFRLGVGTGEYHMSGTPLYSWTAVRGYFWEQPQGRDVVYRALGPVALTAMTAFVLSILAPRFASILATSIIGSAFLATGSGVLVAGEWPETWARVLENGGWAAAAVVGTCLFAVTYQATHPARPALKAPLAPVAAPTA